MTEVHEQWDIVSSVGLTALLVSAARSHETAAERPLIRDDLAGAFVATAGAEIDLDDVQATQDATTWASMVDYMALRTKFLDQYIENAGTEQIVILAAGLDSRAFRLDIPAETRFYEVDQPKVLEFKQEVIEDRGERPLCERIAVGTDLRDDWVSALTEHGFNPERSTAWLAEGLLPYLPGKAEEDLFTRIHELSAPGSMIAVEDAGTQNLDVAFKDERLVESAERLGLDFDQLISREPRRDFAEWLRANGWEINATAISEIEQTYARPVRSEMRELFESMRMVIARR